MNLHCDGGISDFIQWCGSLSRGGEQSTCVERTRVARGRVIARVLVQCELLQSLTGRRPDEQDGP
jgi:hypothetical protein